MSPGVVIVGAGQAGFQAAVSLRKLGYADRVVLVGDEPELPYQRPPLSKELLAGVEARVALRPEAFYAEHAIELRCGDAATRVDRGAREVELASGTRLGYEHLVLATGARNRALRVPGAQLDGVVGLRTHVEARALADGLGAGARIVVIGGGFIGLEVAAAARARGAGVTVVEAADRCMARALSAPTAAHLEGLHRAAGCDLRTGVGVVRLVDDGSGRVSAAVLTDGTVLEAALVVLGVGVLPETTLAGTAGLAVDDGVLVDAALRTSDPAVFAIGDCARFVAGSGTRRLESVQNATDQARSVAATIVTGKPQVYREVPWFWSTQHGARLQIAGVPDGPCTTVVRGDPASGAFSVFCFDDERLCAVESVNRPKDHMAARKLLATNATLTPADAAREDLDLRPLAVVS